MILLKKAAEGDMVSMWSNSEKYPELAEAEMGLQAVEMDLVDELKSSKSTHQFLSAILTDIIVRRVLKKPALQFTTARGDEVSCSCVYILS